MSEPPKRIQFRTLLKCGRCGAEGHAVWEENIGINPDGPMGDLISLSENFFQKVRRGLEGQPHIACSACGATQPD